MKMKLLVLGLVLVAGVGFGQELVRVVDGVGVWRGERAAVGRVVRGHSRPWLLGDEQLARYGVFTVVVDPTVPDGARVDARHWVIEGTFALEVVTAWTSAEDLAAEAEAAEAARIAGLAAAHGADVAILGGLLERFGYAIPVESVRGTIDEIKGKLAAGTLAREDEGAAALLARVYGDLRAVMVDVDMVAVAALLAAMAGEEG